VDGDVFKNVTAYLVVCVRSSAKMDLSEIGWGGVDWIDLAQDRDQWWARVNTVINHRGP
jgi:hypothetical protein